MANTKKTEKTSDLESLKEELTSYIDIKVKKSINDDYLRLQKRLIRDKNKKIICSNIIALALLVLVFYLLYLLKNVHYFDKYFINNNTSIIEVDDNDKAISDDKETIKEEVKPSLEELIDKNKNLLDKIYISSDSIYLKDFYEGVLSNGLKKYLTFNLINLGEYLEDELIVIDEDEFLNLYKTLFDDEMVKENFEYNGVTIHYNKKLNSFICDKKIIKSETNIVREIIGINEKDNEITFEVIEAIKKDNKLYNVVSLNEIENYKKGDLLIRYKSKLTTLKYTFIDGRLANIE